MGYCILDDACSTLGDAEESSAQSDENSSLARFFLLCRFPSVQPTVLGN